jgi:crotonobetainyl-CoA:carnitine CoA-transferase CaiB-like acyl-CoA transferase
MEAKAFSNVRILDFTHYLAGPVGTFQLAMQGADVIKIEPRGGEGMRGAGPDPDWNARGMAPAWMAANAGKRSIAIDLSKPEGAEIVRRLAREADAVVENFRPGVMERLGVGWTQLSKENPRLIYCGVSGFGATGPDSRMPAFDGKIQAMSGLMSLTGEPEQGPMRAGFAAADVATGMMTGFALATALYQRTHTGKGQFVDIAMLDSVINFLACAVAETTVSGVRHAQMGNLSMSRKVTGDRFRCGEGYVVLAVMTEPQFQRLFKALGLEPYLADPRFATWDTRAAHRAELRVLIEDALAGASAIAWETRFAEADVPCGAVYSIDQIIAHRQVAHRGLLQQTQTPEGPVQLVGPAFRLEHGNGGISGPVPALGQDTDTILAEAGYDADAIAALKAAQVV